MQPTGSGPEPDKSIRPISTELRRHAIRLTAPQSDALARLIAERRLVELFCLRNGTLGATLQGRGYAAWHVFLTPDGRIHENADASALDPRGDLDGPLTIARDETGLHLGQVLLPRPERSIAPFDANVPSTDGPGR